MADNWPPNIKATFDSIMTGIDTLRADFSALESEVSGIRDDVRALGEFS